MTPTYVSFPVRSDARGRLVPMEAESDVPFAVRRAYVLLDTPDGVSRGGHAHRALRQVMVALRGACRVSLSDGADRFETTLDRPDRGLLLEPMIWHEMSEFSPDCVLLVLAAEHYDEGDYIRDHAEFLRLAGAVAR